MRKINIATLTGKEVERKTNAHIVENGECDYVLYSYNTPVCWVDKYGNGKGYILGILNIDLTMTTLRHIRAFKM